MLDLNEPISKKKLDHIFTSETFKPPSSFYQCLNDLKSVLQASSSIGPFSLPQANQYFQSQSIAWPWNLNSLLSSISTSSSSSCSFGYAPPEKIDFFNQSLPIPSSSINSFVINDQSIKLTMAIQMPKSLFQSKDYLNYRYFHKRSFYLTQLACILRSVINTWNFNLQFTFEKNDPRLPILVLSLPSLSTPLPVSYHIVISPYTDINVFPCSKLLPMCNSIRPTNTSLGLPPTPLYNACLLSNALTFIHARKLSDTSFFLPCFPSCVLLIQMWCEKKYLPHWTFPLTQLVSHLVNEKDIQRDWDALLVFRRLMFFISNHNFQSPLPLFSSQASSHLSPNRIQFDLKDFECTNGTVFVDEHGCNITYWSCISDIQLLTLHAKHTLSLLEKNAIETVFKKTPPIHPFDHLCLVPIPSKPPAFYNEKVQLDHPCLALYLTQALPKLLYKALSSRILVSTYLSDTKTFFSSSWSITTPPPTTTSLPSHLKFGFLLIPQPTSISLELGPCPDSHPEAAREFRRIWGDRAELRRFPDGQLLLCTEWLSTSGHGDPTLTTLNSFAWMLDYLLDRHLSVRAIHDHATPLLSLLPSMRSTPHVFQSLCQWFPSLPNLPVPIVSLLPLSSHLTRCALLKEDDTSPAQVCLILEKSDRWPTQDPSALYSMLMLFLIRLAKSLKKTKHISAQLITTPLSLQFEYETIPFQLFLDVQGKEHSVLQHALDLSHWTFTYPSLPWIIRLFKLWLAKHQLSIYLHDTIAELLVMEALMNTQPYPTFPIDPKWGFFRVLEYTAHLHGHLFVNTSRDRDASSFSEPTTTTTTTTATHLNGSTLTPPELESNVLDNTMHSYSIRSSHVSYQVPGLLLNRLKYLSKQALRTSTPFQLFEPDFTPYDVIFYLKSSKLIDAFLADLLRLYSKDIFLFYNPLEPTILKCVFDPIAKQHIRPWKPFLKHPKFIDQEFTILNQESMVFEIERLGRGLIEKTEWCSQKA